MTNDSTLSPKERAKRYSALADEASLLPPAERLRRYRQLAEDAEHAAKTVFGAAENAYSTIAQHWRSMAEKTLQA